ncbi:MAG: ABC transporter permease [Candidatus Latescibacterota bacterium]
MKALKYIIKKEFIQLRRTRSMIGIALVMPIVQLVILGFAVSGDVIHVPTALIDLDNSPMSRTLANKFDNTRYLEIKFHSRDHRDSDRYLEENKAIIAITIPHDFERDIARGKRPAIMIKADAQNTNIALTGSGYVRRILQSWLTSLSPGGEIPIALHTINTESRVWYNPELKQTWFMVPGILVLLVTIITMLLTGFAIVREREMGTLEQLMVTPITRTELILGKTIPFAVLGMVDMMLALFVAKIIYQIPIAGSLFLFLGLSLIYLFCTLGLGILVSTVARTQQQALFLDWYILVFCIIMSGFFLPLENMPKLIYYLTYIDPVRYFMTIVRELFLKGSGMSALWEPTVALVILAVILMTSAIIRLNKRLG